MKYVKYANVKRYYRTPPTRGRELKYLGATPSSPIPRDAPHAGARIEINCPGLYPYLLDDAPHAGARIEIAAGAEAARGAYDAPHAGARIEIPIRTLKSR